MLPDERYDSGSVHPHPSDFRLPEPPKTPAYFKFLYAITFLFPLAFYPALIAFTHTENPWFLIHPKEVPGWSVLIFISIVQIVIAAVLIKKDTGKLSKLIIGICIVFVSVIALISQFFAITVASNYECNLYLDTGTDQPVVIGVNDKSYTVEPGSYILCRARAGDNIIDDGKAALAYRFTKGNWIYNYNQSNEYYLEKITYSKVFKVNFTSEPDTYTNLGNQLVFEAKADYIFKAPDQIKTKISSEDLYFKLLQHNSVVRDSLK
jgi:hypothetical protein